MIERNNRRRLILAGVCLVIFSSFGIFSSCGVSDTKAKSGLKLTIITTNKEAICMAAGYPDDPAFIRALDSAYVPAAPNRLIVRNFIQYYRSLRPSRPLTRFFSTGDPAGSEESLEKYLVNVLDHIASRMDKVLKTRINTFCLIDTALIKIDHPAPDKLVVYVPGIHKKVDLQPVFRSRDGLHCWAAADVSELAPYLVRLNDSLGWECRQRQAKALEQAIREQPSLQEIVKEGEDKDESLFDLVAPPIDQQGALIPGALMGTAAFKDTAKAMRLLCSGIGKAITPGHIRWLWGRLPGETLPETSVGLYAVHLPPDKQSPIGDDDVVKATIERPAGQPEIMIRLTAPGSQKFARLTKANIDHSIAIEVSGFVYTAPTVRSEIRGGACSITGIANEKEVEELTKIINAGGFPVPFKVIRTEPYQP